MKKLKLEDTCLTIEQAKELKELGVDFSNAIMAFIDFYDENKHEYELVRNMSIGAYDIIPTLTNTEMLEMLPKVMISEDESIFTLMLERSKLGRYTIGYVDGETRRYSVAIFNDSIRDLLFDMLKWLKTNKLI